MATDTFMAKVEKTASCWLWRGSTNNKGYGKLTVKRVNKYAHRYAYELAHGPIPSGMYVLHSCDTPTCVNPQHLSLGDQKKNMRECSERGRIKHNRDGKCLRGHPFVHSYVRANGQVQRSCRECQGLRYHERKERKGN